MQAFGNVATDPVRKVSKTTGKPYYEFRLCENQCGQSKDTMATWYTVRCHQAGEPGLGKGDFIKATGKLKVDSYLNREGKPTSTLLILAFEAVKLKGVDELKAARASKQEQQQAVAAELA